MDYRAQAEDKAERYKAAFHRRVSVSSARRRILRTLF
jgi:hypothetical protein